MSSSATRRRAPARPITVEDRTVDEYGDPIPLATRAEVDQLTAEREAKVAEGIAMKIEHHRQQLTEGVIALERALEEGADLSELAEWSPVVAAESRARLEQLATWIGRQLVESRTGGSSSRAPLSTSRHNSKSKKG